MLADLEETEGGPSYGPGLASDQKKTTAKKSVQNAKTLTKQKKNQQKGNQKATSLVLAVNY